MGQQQMLLVILATIIVGILTVVAIRLFTEPQWVIEAREERVEYIESFSQPELHILGNGEKIFIYPYQAGDEWIVKEYHFKDDGDNLSDMHIMTTADSRDSSVFENGRYYLKDLLEMEDVNMYPLPVNFTEE